MENLAISSVDYAISEVENLHQFSKKTEVKHTIDDALFHLRRAKECLTEGLKNPVEWVNDTEETMKMIYMMLPFLFLMRDQNLSKRLSDIQSSSNNSEPAAPLGRVDD